MNFPLGGKLALSFIGSRKTRQKTISSMAGNKSDVGAARKHSLRHKQYRHP
jgi:hypothetical protein